MICAIVGSRTFEDFHFMKVSMKEIHSKYKIDTIVSGGAFGADALAEHYAKWKRLKYKIHRPDWKKYGKPAGFIRNKLIINDCDILVAFWDGTSKGTLSSINLAKEQNKPTFIYKF